jgi:membrane protease YdiL (CAAX protease family)
VKKENIFMKIWRVIYPVGIYFLISNVITVAFLITYSIFMNMQMLSSGQTINVIALQEELMSLVYKYAMMLTAIAAAITIPIAYLLFRNDKRKENIEYEKCNSLSYGFIFVLAFGACLGTNQLLTISRLDIMFPDFNKIQQALYGGDIVMEVLAAVILAPIIEELLFRGLVFKRLYIYTGRVPAMLISSLFFGVYHGNVVQGVYAFVVGMVFVFIYDKYKTIIAPILAHMFANLISVLSVEAGIFDVLYVSELSFYVSTVIEIMICIIMIIIIKKKVIRKEIIKNEPKTSDWSYKNLIN